jgi:aspartate/methionine/tyrosine aminotransferase
MEEANKLEATGRNIVHLEIGQPDFSTPANVVSAGVQAIHDGKTTYSNPSGTVDLKHAIAEMVGRTRSVQVSPEEVVVGPGAKPGLFFGILALIESGQEVIIPDPGFPSYAASVEVAGGVCVRVPLNEDKTCYDLGELEAKITDRTRMIITNSPSNPTGGVMTSSDVEEFALLMDSHPSIWILSDEIYSQLVYTGQGQGQTAPSLLQVDRLRDRTIMIDGFSKTYCMTGWRLGYAVMPVSLAKRMHLLIVHAVGCTATFTQAAGVEAITGPQDQLAEMVAEYQKRRDYVIGRLRAIPGVSCPTPEGAFYAFPNIAGLNMGTAKEVAHDILHDAGVAVLPGTDFGPCGEGHIRLSYVRDMGTLEEGMDRITDLLTRKGRPELS